MIEIRMRKYIKYYILYINIIMSALKAFNNQLENFTVYLEKQFPNELNIKTYHKSISMLRKVNPRKILEYFNKYVYVYKKEIMASDDTFFINKDYNEELDGNKDSMLTAMKFKDLWKNSGKDVHEQIFRYYQLLCLLSEKC